MEHLTFVIWMLLFPLVIAIDDYMDAKTKLITKEAHVPLTMAVAIFMIVFWFVIGAFVY